MRITESQLRQMIRESVRFLLEDDRPFVEKKNGKVAVWVDKIKQEFDFSPDEVEKVLRGPATIYDDAYDEESENGCMMSRDRRGGEIKVTVHKEGAAIFTDTIDDGEIKSL